MAAELSLRASLEGQGPRLRSGAYFNPERSGAGLFLHPAGSDWVAIWYTYLQDGSPTWYYLQAPAPAAYGQWRSPIYRAAWNGTAATLTPVGQAALTPRSADAASFSFTLDGETGSEAIRVLGRGCPSLGGQVLDNSQHWFDPRRAGSGYSVQFMAPPSVGQAYEFFAAFVYDDQGQPRFLIGEGPARDSAEALFPLQQLAGWCPLCPRPGAGPQRVEAGSLLRRIESGRLRGITLDARLGLGVSGLWLTADAVQPLDPLARMSGCMP